MSTENMITTRVGVFYEPIKQLFFPYKPHLQYTLENAFILDYSQVDDEEWIAKCREINHIPDSYRLVVSSIPFNFTKEDLFDNVETENW